MSNTKFIANIKQSKIVYPTLPTGLHKSSRLGVFLFAAGVITGVNWFMQTALAKAQQAKQNQIIKRVNDKATVNINQLGNITKLKQIQGSRVKVTGVLQAGRFIIKRNRGSQQGYIVLAPFTVDSLKPTDDAGQHSINLKYMLNLGWVPKTSKHRIKQTAAYDILSLNELPQELAEDQQAIQNTTITAYVRSGEQRDILRGRNNWAKSQLYKYIDLGLMERVYNSVFPGFRHVYLDRMTVQDSLDKFPFPKNDEQFIDQLKQEIAENNKSRRTLSWGIGVTSFATAVLLGVL